MSFDSILVPHDGSPEAAKALGCAAWLAQRLDATLHVITPAGLQIAAEQRSRMVLHQTTEKPGSAVPRAIAAHAVKLVVMTARGESASAGVDPERRLGRVAEALIAESAVPVLLLPNHYHEVLPWTSMLVAASGEAAADQALEIALQLASALQLELSVVYCESPRTKAGALGAYADAAHYEYPQRLEELVRRTVSQHPECHCIAQVLLCRGDPAAELLAQIAQRASSVLALGWHGALDPGRAQVLKRLLEKAECPLLVVRQAARPSARLKVGEEL